jgi:hypothetical protein
LWAVFRFGVGCNVFAFCVALVDPRRTAGVFFVILPFLKAMNS